MRGNCVLLWLLASISQIIVIEPARHARADARGSNPKVLREPPARLKREPRWVTGPRCGPNSLYVLLKLQGIDADIDRVTELCNLDPRNGCSIADLERVGREMGLATEVRYVTPSELATLDRPFIANLRAGDEQPSSAHFLLIFDYREDRKDFGIIDGTGGFHAYRDAGVLMRSFSGYVLVPRRRSIVLSMLRGTLLAGLSVICCLFAWQIWGRTALTSTRGTLAPTPR